MRFAASLVGPDEAADVVSEAVASTLRRRSLSSIEHPAPYLMQAVLNTARSRGRRLARERRAMARHGRADPAVQLMPVEPSELAAAVARLPLQQRAAVYLVYWEDLTPTRAAEALGVRPATLRRYLHLARRKLRDHLDE
jgi:RNA polymerase sigma-70 factor (ECF subfamily)